MFSIERAADVVVEVIDLAGRRVRVLSEGPMEAGNHRLVWDGRDGAGVVVATGTYLARVVSNGGVATGKLVVLR